MKTTEDNTKMNYHWTDTEGLFQVKETENVYVGNFYPEVKDVQDIQEEKYIVLNLKIVGGYDIEIMLPVKKLQRVRWFDLCQQCLIDEHNKEAYAFLRYLVQVQVAQYEREITRITHYTQLGWNVDVYGNNVYVFGNGQIGGDKNAKTASHLSPYKLSYLEEKQGEMLKIFIDVLKTAPMEGLITLGYFFTGLLRQLYKEAGVPVDFILYLAGEQQNRKTTLAKLTNNLYCRDTDMDFAVRTVEKTSNAVAEKLISAYKDTTLILDDVSKTRDKKYQQKQEDVVEHIVRLVGNRARKSINSGNGVRECLPNANVIITGEYIPIFSESTLSRMLILEIDYPIEAYWLRILGENPQMLSTVAYSFLSCVQMDYDRIVSVIKENFSIYRHNREKHVPYQERLNEHGFIMESTYYILHDYLCKNGYSEESNDLMYNMTAALKSTLLKQVRIIKKIVAKDSKKDFCAAFAELYNRKKLSIAQEKECYDKNCDDAFFQGKDIICITTVNLRDMMRIYYNDSTITIQAVTKQFREARFLLMDNSKNLKSTKKLDNERYLHILKVSVKEYYKYSIV
ncbi:MAG: DUF927 domain-containing protein [Lachnospiraceae bacterium]|nr:DUF927 domain-containing protein [Lachnospiraceae bacterium]